MRIIAATTTRKTEFILGLRIADRDPKNIYSSRHLFRVVLRKETFSY